MGDAIKSTIDAAGRVVIPKRIREQVGLTAGMPVTISEHDGSIEVQRAPLDVELVRRGSVSVIEPRETLPPIDADDVRTATERIRQE